MAPGSIPAVRWILAAALVVSAAASQAPEGFRTHAADESGMSFIYPVDFVEQPLPPTEQVVKARYVRRTVPDAMKKAGANERPEFEVVVIPKPRGGTTPVTPAAPKPASRPESAPASKPDSRRSAPEGPRTVREAMIEAGRIEGFDEFKQKRLPGWNLKPIGVPSGPIREYGLTPANAGPPNAKWSRAGFLCLREERDSYVGVVGTFASTIERESQAELRKIARSITLNVESGAGEKIAAFYQGKDLRNIPFRAAARAALPKGWNAIDTENFIVVYHSDNEKLVNKIARDLEAIRPTYVELFPPAHAIDAVSVVRICKNQQEYATYGGPPRTGGYWHCGNEELVFFDYYQTLLETEKPGARRLSDKDSLLVLYHEAFHQYIYYAVGQISPHDWFNEGHGDYFSGALIPQYGTRVTSIGPSRWRITPAKKLLEAEQQGDEAPAPKKDKAAKDPKKPGGGWIPLAQLIHASHQEYYNPAQISNFYAGGWSLVYFLREAPEVKKNPRWSRILPIYFDTLKTEYGRWLAGMASNATLREKEEAGAASRDAALKAAFDGVDLPELEVAWKSFILKCRHPWPEDRGS